MSTRDYPSAGLTIHWDDAVCLHSRICASELPQVFRPAQKPWIQADAATADEIAATIDHCPSGALRYTRDTDGATDAASPVAESSASHSAAPGTPPGTARAAGPATVHVHENGPLEVQGDMTIVGADGRVLRASRRQYFCRCGGSANKPYCDNSHLRVGFTDPGLGRT